MDKQRTFLDPTDNSFPACTSLNLQYTIRTEWSVWALQKAILAELGFCADKQGDDLLLKAIYRALMPWTSFQILITRFFWVSFLEHFQNFHKILEIYHSATGNSVAQRQRSGLWHPGLLPSQAGSSSMHAPPSGSQSQDTQAFTELLSQDLLDGGEVLTYGPGFSSKIQSCL